MNFFFSSVAYLAPEIIMKHGHNRTVDWYLVGMLTYELIVGIPPYYSGNRQELFENIKQGPLMMPKHISTEAKSFIRGCLQRIPSKRLGALNDAKEVKDHEWFKGIDWGKVLRKEYKAPMFNETQFKIGSVLILKIKWTVGKNWTVAREREMKENY